MTRTRTVCIDLSANQATRLAYLEEATGYGPRDVLMQALAVYDTLFLAEANGSRFLMQEPGSEPEPITLVLTGNARH